MVKMPKWPFDKFADASRTLGTQMKATGEVMAIAPSFEMALMKAVRGAEMGLDSLNRKTDPEDHAPIWRAAAPGGRPPAVHRVRGPEVRHQPWTRSSSITRIDRWFLCKLKNMADFEKALEAGRPHRGASTRPGKRLGYPDDTLQRLSGAESAARAPQDRRLQDGGHLRRGV